MRSTSRALPLLFHLCLGLGLVAASATAQPPTRNPGYRLGPKDLVEIRVVELQELNVERARLREGRDQPALPRGHPRCRPSRMPSWRRGSKTELEPEYMQRASVSVQVRRVPLPPDLGDRRRRPAGQPRLLRPLDAARGHHGRRRARREPRQTALRPAPRRQRPLRPDRHPTSTTCSSRPTPGQHPDLRERPDQRAGVLEVTIYCLGEVAQPGALTFKSTERITLLTAIARAGGLTDRAPRARS